MALTVGSRLAHYDVTALIGEGGMGQVYQATDTKLNRQVALKILPEAFAADPDRLARFQREAQVLASLNHPGIAAIYGIEEADDTRALVLELVEGPTLADRIAQGPIPVDEALPIAKQIAEALEAAHEQGVIHRDLKPANIKVREDGTVKVLDFGLAKALDPSHTGDPSQSPTLTAAATQMGVIMGTAAYMSPEQAAGRPVDKRSDIWSFGVVFFEMLTGDRLFVGETVPHVLARVLDWEPDLGVLPEPTPAAVGRLLRRCLRKDRGERLHDIADARLEITDALTVPERDDVGIHQPGFWQRPAAAVIGALVLVSVAVLVTLGVTDSNQGVVAESGPTKYLPVAVPEGVSLTYDPEEPGVTISPGGRHVVFVGASEGERLYLLDLERPEDATPIAGTEGARAPFVSPDGVWVAFEANNKLLKVNLNGGDAVELADVASFRGGTWSQDAESIYYTPVANGGLYRVSTDGGGEPEAISMPDRDGYDMEHEWPDILPGGGLLLYSSCCWPERIMVLDLETGQRHQLIENGFFPRYVSTGHILFARGGSLLAVRFDPVSLEVGTPEEVIGDLVTGNDHPAEFAVSQSGDLVYLSGVSDSERVLVRVDATGTAERLAADAYADPMRRSMSPNGQRLALSMRRGPGSEARANVSQTDVYLYDLVRGVFDRVTLDPHGDWTPVWRPDGRDVVFSSVRGGPADLYVRPVDRSAPAALLYASEFDKWPSSWSPDGTLLAFEQQDPVTGWDTWIYSTEAPTIQSLS